MTDTMGAGKVKTEINNVTLTKGLEHRDAPVYVQLEDGERRLITSIFGVVDKDGVYTVHLYAGELADEEDEA